MAQAATSDEALAETLAAAAPIEPPAPPVAARSRPSRRARQAAGLDFSGQGGGCASAKARPDASRPSHHTTRGGWAIQVGAYEDEGEAKQHLNSAKGKVARVLQKAEAYIERTVKGAKTYYRARFAGLRPRPGRSRLQAPQARRHRLHGVEDLIEFLSSAYACGKRKPA